MKTKTHSRPLLGLLALLVLLPAAAQAADLLPRDEGFMKEPKSVAYRLYSLSGKSDIGLFGAFSMKNKLTQHQGAALEFDQQFNEYFALDVFADGGAGTLTGLASNIRQMFRFSGTGDDLADAGALLATGQLGLRFTPIYGKLSLSSELAVHFNFYAVGGAGVALVNFNDILTCATDLGGSSRCPGDNYRSEMDPKPAFNVGGGFRFYVTQLLSARVEVRDVMFLDQYLSNVNFKSPQGTGTVTSSGVSQVPLVLVGVGFLL